jgi:hypothetical protein
VKVTVPPLSVALHVTPLGSEPHDADPGTYPRLDGMTSVIVTGAADVDSPVLVAVNV